MSNIHSYINRQNSLFIFCFIVIIGLFGHRALISIGTIGIVTLAVINPQFKTTIKRFVHNPIAWALTSIFLIYLISGLYSEDVGLFFTRIKTKVPFILLPFSFLIIHKFSPKKFYAFLYLFIILVLIYSSVSIISYLQAMQMFNKSYLSAGVLPTPINHIRFSLMVAFAILCGWYVYFRKVHIWHHAERIIILSITIFLFIYIHLLAVRSGLLALYLAMTLHCIMYIFKRKKYISGAGLLILIAILPYLSYQIIPTFRNKIDYSLYDLHLYQSKKLEGSLSDTRRLRSIEGGIAIGKKNLLVGCGLGDIQGEMNSFYNQIYPNTPVQDRLLPHNQFVHIFATTGVIGLFVFCSALCVLFFHRTAFNCFLCLSINVIIFSSLFTEATFEVQFGVTFYILCLLLGLNQQGFYSAIDG